MSEFSTIIRIVLMLMGWADRLFTYAHEQKLIKEGEDRAIARAALTMAARSKVAREVEDEYANLPMDEVRKRLEGQFRD